jgi:hypothetical protein
MKTSEKICNGGIEKMFKKPTKFVEVHGRREGGIPPERAAETTQLSNCYLINLQIPVIN